MGPDSLAGATLVIKETFNSLNGNALPFDDLYLWAEKQDTEITELVISLLLELDDTSDEVIDRLLMVDSERKADLNATIEDLKIRIDENYFWLKELDLSEPEALSLIHI